MSAFGNTAGSRLCLVCGAAAPIRSDAPLWPVGLRCGTCGHTVPVRERVPQYAPALADTLAGFDPQIFADLVSIEPGHFWFEPRSRLLTGLAARHFPAATRYLEVGCGTGVVLAAMAGSRSWARLAGSELHPSGLSYAKDRLGGRAEFIQMDARAIPAREAFDLIGAFDVLEHIVEDETVLREIHAALVPGGGLLAAVPQHPALWSDTDVIAHHVRRYQRGELEAKLRAAHFEIVFSSSYATLVLPFLVASRVLARGNRTDWVERRREFAMHPFINYLFRQLLHAEVSLSLAGVTWPAGGSRVVVARKPPC